MMPFSRKLYYWTSEVEHNDFECFTTLTELLLESEKEIDVETINDINDHLAGLSESLTMYFPNLERREHRWIQNPFRVTEKPLGFLSTDFEKLIEITSDTQLMANFEEMPLDVFWGISMKNIVKCR